MSAYSAAVLADSPTAYWRLGEAAGVTAADASGNAHTGTYVNTPTLGATSLLSGDTANKAVTFTAASSQYVTTDTLGTLGANIGHSSWEFWIKGASAEGGVIGVSAGSNTRMQIYIGDANPGDIFFFVRADTNQIGADTASGSLVDDGNPHHVVCLADESTMTVAIYIDGVAVALTPFATGTDLAAAANFTEVAALAATSDVPGSPFNGTLDEIAVYPTLLSPARITAHYEAGASGGADPHIGGTITVPVSRRVGVTQPDVPCINP